MSLVALPVFALSRKLGIGRPLALAAAALSLAVPDLLFASWVMAEPFAYPLFVGVVLAGTTALAEPSRRRGLVLVALVALAAFARAQFVILPLCFVAAVFLVGLRERRLRLGAPRASTSVGGLRRRRLGRRPDRRRPCSRDVQKRPRRPGRPSRAARARGHERSGPRVRIRMDHRAGRAAGTRTRPRPTAQQGGARVRRDLPHDGCRAPPGGGSRRGGGDRPGAIRLLPPSARGDRILSLRVARLARPNVSGARYLTADRRLRAGPARRPDGGRGEDAVPIPARRLPRRGDARQSRLRFAGSCLGGGDARHRCHRPVRAPGPGDLCGADRRADRLGGGLRRRDRLRQPELRLGALCVPARRAGRGSTAPASTRSRWSARRTASAPKRSSSSSGTRRSTESSFCPAPRRSTTSTPRL